MPTVTREVIESYLSCRYKSYLTHAGRTGEKSDYENLHTAIRKRVELDATDRIHAQCRDDRIVRDVPVSTALLKRGHSYILAAAFEDDLLTLSLDGCKRVEGVSKLGGFLYIPMLFYEGDRVQKEQRLLLELYGLILSRYQGVAPTTGIVWHGRECTPTTVRLNPDHRKARQMLLDLKRISTGEEEPRLVLNPHCAICEFREQCHEQAVAQDNLSLLRGMSEKEIKGYNRKGILTITQLSHTFRPRRQSRKGKKVEHRPYRHDPSLQALAIRDRKIYVIGEQTISKSPVRIYLDVEGNSTGSFVYLIGLVVACGTTVTEHSFWADDPAQEREIFDRFIEVVTRYRDVQLFCYGKYEKTFITRMRKQTRNLDLVDRALGSLVNTLSHIYAHIYFPTYSNSLKEIGRAIGCCWTEPDASGIQSIVWRRQWEETRDDGLKQKLMRYNLEDCRALKRVTELVETILMKPTTEPATSDAIADCPPITSVEDIEKLTDYHTWSNLSFVQPDYDFINKRAYFDYQRERVYIRTSQTIRKLTSRTAKPSNRRLKKSKSVVIIAEICPVCNGNQIIRNIRKPQGPLRSRVRRTMDLISEPTGVRRRIVEYRTSVHRCLECNEEFIPSEYLRLDKHCHGLKSWVIYHHVNYPIGLATLSKMIAEFFGMNISWPEIYMFKSLMATYYKDAHQRILDRILSGTLIHVDETEMKLQRGKGYVWVFTNLEEVVYMYRPNREAGFLHELLKEYQGVVISDFYSAYDSLRCPQQKCLIHLIRDINQELLNNPFDSEVKEIAQSFGILLRAVVASVDEHGLRRAHLRRHDPQVRAFFASLEDRILCSDAAESIRARLVKYRDKLFTFIHHDGVPWNNNNAEHAIKQFAYYRERVNGSANETGLTDYLVLLSICQTCQYKGVSFYRFLLSKEQDIDEFARRRRKKRRLPDIELYPEGFIPPHHAFHERNKVKKR